MARSRVRGQFESDWPRLHEHVAHGSPPNGVGRIGQGSASRQVACPLSCRLCGKNGVVCTTFRMRRVCTRLRQYNHGFRRGRPAVYPACRERSAHYSIFGMGTLERRWFRERPLLGRLNPPRGIKRIEKGHRPASMALGWTHFYLFIVSADHSGKRGIAAPKQNAARAAECATRAAMAVPRRRGLS